jgi:hypothetical protein
VLRSTKFSVRIHSQNSEQSGSQYENKAELWLKVAERVSDLMSKLIEPPYDYDERVSKYLQALSDLVMTAVSHSADKLEKQPKSKPRALKPKARYQFELLDIWTSLGGGLGIAHGDPDDGTKVTGPLSRYFAAAAVPVCGGSLQTLRDITKNYKNAIRDGTWRPWWWRQWRWRRRREAQG